MTLKDLIADAPALSAAVAALTFIVAIGTFVKAIFEYRRQNVAYYMGGYYAIRCMNSKYFWMGHAPDRNSIYWHLFADFAKKMAAIERKCCNRPVSSRKLRF
ncbi:MAG TPA: hypothetical protein VIZ17_09045 [Acetobacteraceae bacterium]